MLEPLMTIECPYCERNTLIGVPVDRIARISPKYRSFQILGQECECENARPLTLAHIYIDENGVGEALYEYSNAEYSRNPVYDDFYGRFDE